MRQTKGTTMRIIDQIIILPARFWAWVADKRHERREIKNMRRTQLRAGKDES